MKDYLPNCEVKAEMLVPEGVTRNALIVEYSGKAFNGFQKQSSTSETVQGHLEKALSSIAAEPVTLVCAGRTDSGVHATAQVVHFDTRAQRPNKAWVEGVNTRLPRGIRVMEHYAVPMEFHARFSALARTYQYVMYCDRVRPAIFADWVTWVGYSLDVNNMNLAAQALVGEHDFTSFRASYCQANTPVRHIHHIKVEQRGAFIVMEVKANAFLHHMVRNIVGALLEVGRGAKPVEWLEALKEEKDRSKNAATAPPLGLFFVHVEYPEQFPIRAPVKAPLFLPS